MAINLTDENLPIFLGPLLKDASKQLQTDINGYFKDFEEKTLGKAVELAVEKVLEKSKPKTEDKPKGEEFDPTNPEHLRKRVKDLRKAKALAEIDMDDPDAIEAALSLVDGKLTKEQAAEAKLAKAQRELDALRQTQRASNQVVPASNNSSLSLGSDAQLQQNVLAKSMVDSINERRGYATK